MGFDIYGLNPKNETGKYFRSNCWSWRPIANYILEMVPPELTGKCKYWMTNDGDGLDAENSEKLVAHLRMQFADGTMDSYRKGYEAAQFMTEKWAEGTGKQNPNCYFFRIYNMGDFCDFLENCGGFTIN